MPAPALPRLQPVSDMPPGLSGSQTSLPPLAYIDPDMLQRNGEKTIIDLVRQEQEADRLN